MTHRFFIQYLLQQNLNSTNDLMELRDNVQIVLSVMYEVATLSNTQSQGTCSLDTLEMLLNECIQNQTHHDLLKFTPIDIWQGLQYLINQGLLKNQQGIPILQGTWMESEVYIVEMSQRLGQYMYVLN